MGAASPKPRPRGSYVLTGSDIINSPCAKPADKSLAGSFLHTPTVSVHLTQRNPLTFTISVCFDSFQRKRKKYSPPGRCSRVLSARFRSVRCRNSGTPGIRFDFNDKDDIVLLSHIS